MKAKNLLLTLATILMFSLCATAQTKTKSKTTTKKAPAKAISVYLCDDGKDKLYHKRTSCAVLNKCHTEIKNIKSVAALKKYKRKACLRCYNM